MIPERLSNPYVGPRTFKEEDKEYFFGRDKEAHQLLSRVMAERLVLFYAQSGAGKSSLINTRLRPELVKEYFQVLPTVRVGGMLPEGITEVKNIFVFNLISNLETNLENASRFTHTKLMEYLQALIDQTKEIDEFGEEKARVLIIDQFEEIITTNLDRWEERETFFAQLADAMEADPLLFVVLSMREDHVAAIEPYARFLPGGMRNRYYMQRMKAKAALKAITEPAQKGNRPFTTTAAEQLVKNLRQLRSKTKEKTGEPALGEFIEPVQLQVVCYQLWQNLNTQAVPPSKISEGDLLKYGDVDEALSNFYESIIADVLQETKTNESELTLRMWFENKLITEAGTRDSAYQGQKTTEGLANETVLLLANKYLLRSETRAGGVWFELIHDRFVDPILAANQKWRERQNLLIQAALDWDESGRPETKLLVGRQLQTAKEQIGDGQVDSLVSDYLEECAKADAAIKEKEAQQQRELELERRRVNTFSVALVVSVGFIILAVFFAIRASRSEAEAVEAKAIAEASAQEAEAQQIEAIKARETAEASAQEAEAAQKEAEAAQEDAEIAESQARARLYMIQAREAYLDNPLLGIRLALEGLNLFLEDESISDTNRELIGAGRIASRGHDIATLTAHPDNNALFILEHEEGLSEIWHANNSEPLTSLIDPLESVVFSDDGTRFVVDYPNKPGELRRTEEGELVAVLSGNIDRVFFSPIITATIFVVNYEDEPAEVWDSATGELLAPLNDEVSEIIYGPEASVFVVDYLNPNNPDELRKADGSWLAQFEDSISNVTFYPEAQYFTVEYLSRNLSELRHINDGSKHSATLEQDISNITFDPTAQVFVVDYESSDTADKLINADGSILAALESDILDVTFNADSQLYVVNYFDRDILDEIRKTDGTIHTALEGDIELAGVTFSPDASVFVVDYANSDVPGELRSATDGTILTTLESEIAFAGVTFSPDASVFVVDYANSDVPSELRSATNGVILANLESEISDVTFHAESQLFIVDYRDPDILDELRRTADGMVLTTFLNDLPDVVFSSDAESSILGIQYNFKRSEVRHISDGEELSLAGEVENITFSPDATLFFVDYLDSEIHNELRSLIDGEPLLTGFFTITLSLDTPHFVVDYFDPEIPDELRSTADGTIITSFEGDVSDLTFNSDPPIFVVNYEDENRKAELRRTEDAQLLVEFSKPDVADIRFNADREFFVVTYGDQSAEIFRTADNQMLQSFTGQVSHIVFDNDIHSSLGDIGDIQASPLTTDQLTDRVTDSRGDAWIFTGQAGDTITLDMSGDFDTYLLLQDADGNMLTSNDDFDEVSHSRIDNYALPYSGVYAIIASGFSGQTGAYTLFVDGINTALLGDNEDTLEIPAATTFVVHFANTNRAEVWHIENGQRLATLSDVAAVTFSPDPAKSVFEVVYNSGLYGLFRTADGSRVTRLDATVSEITFSPDENVTSFIVKYTDGSVDLHRTTDAQLLARLSGNISLSEKSAELLNPTGDALIFGLRYAGEPTQLYSSIDGKRIIELSGDAYDLTCSPQAEAEICIVSYIDRPGELRQAETGALLEELADIVRTITFSPDPDGGVFIIDYDDGSAELRQTADGELLETFTGGVLATIFGPDSEATLLAVNYSDGSAELRQTADGLLLQTLNGAVANLSFNPDETLLFVNYTNGTVELRQAAGGQLLAPLAGEVYETTFNPNADLFILDYFDDAIPDELRRTADGQLITKLPDQVTATAFSPDPEATLLSINYAGTYPEVRYTLDGSLLVTLTVEIDEGILFPEETLVTSVNAKVGAAFFIVVYDNLGLTEVRRTSDGSLVTTFTGEDEVADLIFSSDVEATIFGVQHNFTIPEVRHISDGGEIPLTDEVENITFSPDAAFFFVDYFDPTIPNELRNMLDGEPLLTDFFTVTFSPDTSLFVVDFLDPEIPDVLRSTADNIFLDELENEISSSIFNTGSPYFVINYLDPNTGAELRNTDNGTIITSFEDDVSDLTFNSDPPIFVVNYEDENRKAELRRTEDAQLLVEFSKPDVADIRFNADREFFVVTYGDQSAEIFRTTDNQMLQSFTGQVSHIVFDNDIHSSLGDIGDIQASPLTTDQLTDRVTDSQGDAWIFTGQAGDTITLDMSGDFDTYLLLQDADGNMLTSNDDFDEVSHSRIDNYALPYSGVYAIIASGFSGQTGAYTLFVDGINTALLGDNEDTLEIPAATTFVVHFANTNRAEVWHIENGQRLATLSDVAAVTFSPDPAKSVFEVVYNSGLHAMFRTTDGKSLAEEVTDVLFSPDAAATYFIATYDDAPGEIFNTADPEHITTLTDEVTDIEFSDENGNYLVVKYTDGHSEVWDLQGEQPRLLVDLGTDVGAYFFDTHNQRLVVRYEDRHVYLVDFTLLETLSSVLTEESSAVDLLRETCAYLFSPGTFDEELLLEYLEENEPLACQ